MTADYRTGSPAIFQTRPIGVFIVLADFRHGPLNEMATKRDRIRIEIFDAAEERQAGEETIRIADTAMLQLARLIGRQIAREQFERKQARERKQQRRRPNIESPL